MKYFVLLAALLLFAGCDIFGIHVPGPGGDTITYRVESDSTSPTLVMYMLGPDEYASTRITEYPWDIIVPNYDGIKTITAYTFEDDVEVSIHYHGRQIASAESRFTNNRTNTSKYIGTIAHAESYELESHFAFPGAQFTLEYGGMSRTIKLGTGDNPRYQELLTFKPGDVLRVTKENETPEGSFALSSQANAFIASYTGFGTFEYEIHFGEAH